MVETAMIELARDGERRFEAHRASPAQGGGKSGKAGIMILSEMFGLNDPMRNFARHYAERGHCVMVPNVFWRCEPSGGLGYDEKGFELAWARLRAFDYVKVADDMRLVADALRRQPGGNGKVVALGFCMGGRLAFIAAARSGVDAALSLYALGIPNHLGEMGGVSVPVQFHYGMQDRHVPLSEVDAVERAAKGNPHITVYRYPDAGHSFFNKVRPTYDPAAAALCARRIDAVLAM